MSQETVLENCKECGVKLRPEALFCHNCGVRLEVEIESPNRTRKLTSEINVRDGKPEIDFSERPIPKPITLGNKRKESFVKSSTAIVDERFYVVFSLFVFLVSLLILFLMILIG